MKYTRKCFLNSDSVEMLDSLLEIEKGDNVYYEAKLKYCNFFLRNPGDNGDKEEIKTIFDNLIKAEYYKACYDYGRFLMDEKKYDEAKNIFKKGSDNGQQFCFGDYADILMLITNFKEYLTDYNMISFLLKNMCLIICLEKLS